MPSWNNEETSSEEECEVVGMDMGLMDSCSKVRLGFDCRIDEEPDTTVEPLFCGQLELAHPKCILHQMRPIKRVAFEGPVTGRRFYGCPVQENGVNCGVVEWVDGPWPIVLQRCLCKLWEMFHEQNFGRVQDKEKFEKELARLKSEHERELAKLRTANDKLCIEYTKLVDDVSKMFDWQDCRVDKQMYQKQVEEEELEKKKKKKKKELEEKAMLEVQMEKLKLAKEQRCILQSQADIIKNTRKAMKDVEVDRDVLKKEKAKLELVVAELLKEGYGSKEKLEQIKAILES
nr:uncharacterized protein LOC120963463 [Aegilops tauschii subsp. strangulata]